MHSSYLFICGDVQVLETGVKQEVLVDFVSSDIDRRSTIKLRVIRQVDLQNLQNYTFIGQSFLQLIQHTIGFVCVDLLPLR